MLSGAFLINKPPEYTSSDVVAKLKKPLSTNGYCEHGFKIGHGGTLDPFATGVLVVLIGEATKLADCYLHSIKSYDGIIELGTSTNTGDFTGLKTDEKSVPHLDSHQWQHLANQFCKDAYLQVPPMYSAKKKEGVSLHEFARQGIVVERKAILKKIYSFEILPLSFNELKFSVRCESGTYVRVLAQDLAQKAGTVAHLKSLRRTASSDACLENTIELESLLEKLVAKTDLHTLKAFIPMEKIATHIKTVHCDEKEALKIKSGLQPFIQSLCEKASLLHQNEHYILVRHGQSQRPVALLEKTTHSPSFRLQRGFND